MSLCDRLIDADARAVLAELDRVHWHMRTNPRAPVNARRLYETWNRATDGRWQAFVKHSRCSVQFVFPPVQRRVVELLRERVCEEKTG